MTATLKQLKYSAGEYLLRNRGTSEFDMSINDISREMLDAARREWGKVYLYNVNLYKDTPRDWTEYTGQKVYNFEYRIMSPVPDQELKEMILQRDQSPRLRGDMPRLNEIFDRIKFIGAEVLNWA